ncbi:MAG: hypothetical protein D6707_07700 [Bacteroidetes bacterium]|nr:MAG: hypothetical protein D6707_07700 [Bacteroidota bacterium]
MKKLVLSIIPGLLLFSCKKGEKDPDFSLRSRKNRLAGEWKITQAQKQHADTVWTFTQNQMILKIDTLPADTFVIDFSWTFDAQGTYEKIFAVTYPPNYWYDGSKEVTQTTTEKGIWNFSGGAGTTKKKSQLVLTEETVTTAADDVNLSVSAVKHIGNPFGKIYQITGLSNKKLYLDINYTREYAGGTTVLTESWEFDKQ